MSGIVITLSLLACILVISEACNKSSGGSTGAHTVPPSSGYNDNVYGPGSGPIPPHPFRRRRGDNVDESALTLQEEALNRMMRAVFSDLDADGDSTVCSDEWVRRKGSVADFKQIMTSFDQNGDGLLSLDEFLAASKS